MIEVFKDDDGYTIRQTDNQRFKGVIERLTKKQLESIYKKVGKVLKRIDIREL